MGCWSVYCGISKIAISDDMDCVLLPLEKKFIGGRTLYEYDEYVPATLPIFGKYNDYGNIVSIKKDFNTKLIEETYDCDIETFCNYLTNESIRDTITNDKLASLNNLTYTWIELNVWNYMSKYNKTRNKKEHFFCKDILTSSIGIRLCDESTLRTYEQLNKTLIQENKEPIIFPKYIDPIGVVKELIIKYAELIEESELCEILDNMVNIRYNMRPLSEQWTPFINYLTPQSGDYQNYKKIIKTFMKINNKKIDENY